MCGLTKLLSEHPWTSGILAVVPATVIAVGGITGGPAAAQVSPGAQTGTTVTGTVLDAETGRPIPGANVFLAHTSRGSSTDSTGRFHIGGVRAGDYELVVSMVGYQSSRATLQLQSGIHVDTTLTISPTTVELDSLQVRGERPQKWQERIRIFERQLLGTTPNGSDAELLNPEVVSFTKSGGQLIASAEEPLTIHNPRLGYRIRLVLDQFVYSPRKGLMRFRGWPYFEQLPARIGASPDRRIRHRRQAYHGSFRHFLRTLARGELQEEGFYVKPIRARISPLAFRALSETELVTSHPNPVYSVLSYGKPFRVIYTGAAGEPIRGVETPVQSRLAPERDSIRFHTAGYLSRPYGIIQAGYMSRLGLADAVPHDYQPSESEQLVAPTRSIAEDSSGIVQGRISTEEGTPLAGVNVFPANTTYGTTSDSTGRYRLRLPAGRYTLIVSAVGYEKYSRPVTVTSDEPTRVSPELPRTTYELPEVRAEAEQGNWTELFRDFRKAFLGRSRNARETRILNKYALGFEHRGRMLYARSDEPLRIVNCGLGYLTTYHLERFSWKVGTGEVKFGGWSHHEPLETIPDTLECKEDSTQWAARRRATYLGSQRHFLQILGRDDPEKHGFYLSIAPEPDFPRQPISADSLRTPTQHGSGFYLTYDGYLRVKYQPRRGIPIFSPYGPVDNLESSVLIAERDTVPISEHGQVLQPFAVTASGAMSRWRIADLLPYDYRP